MRIGKNPQAVDLCRESVTTEEGQVRRKAEFLAGLRPLPAGLTGGITVRDLAVDEPAQPVATDAWPGVVGTYRSGAPDGWMFHVALRDGEFSAAAT